MGLDRCEVDGGGGAEPLAPLRRDDSEGGSLVVRVCLPDDQACTFEFGDDAADPFATHDCLLAKFGHPQATARGSVDNEQYVVPRQRQAGRRQGALDLRYDSGVGTEQGL